MKYVIAMILALGATTAAADTSLRIATGVKGGGYDKAAQALSQRLSQSEIASIVDNYAGSDEITKKLCNEMADVGFAQADAIWKRDLEGCALQPIALHTTEIATIWFPPDSDFDDLSDLNENSRVLVGKVGSGGELTFKTMKFIETDNRWGDSDDWAKAQIVNGDLNLASGMAASGKIDAIITVQAPGAAIFKKFQQWGFNRGEFWDRDLNDLVINKTSLYDYNGRYYGYEVPAFVVAGPNTSEDTMAAVAQELQ